MKRLWLAAALAACEVPVLNEVDAPVEPPSANSCLDADGDGYGRGGLCRGADCDDTDTNIHVDAGDQVGNGVDDNCDGVDGVDADGDGKASSASGGTEDCDDTEGSVNAGAPDAVGDGTDNNCDGVDGVDRDVDGYASRASGGTDCDDSDTARNPGATDLGGDSVDQNCDGADGVDGDGDGFAAVSSGGSDCNDGSFAENPAATDLVGNATDENCDGLDGLDGDQDGYASVGSGGTDCDDATTARRPGTADLLGDGVDQNCDGIDGVDADGDGFAAVFSGGSDCNDDALTVNPGSPSDVAGNGVDENCDGGDGVDGDGDGYPSRASGGSDCDDGAPSRNPGATDLGGDGIDQNCDGTDGVDADRDGYAAAFSGGSDCDDADIATNPGNSSDVAGNGVDENCDGIDGIDADGDGFAAATSSGTDCDDAQEGVFPGVAFLDSPSACMKDTDADGYGDDTPGVGITPGTDCNDDDAFAYAGAASVESSTACMRDADGDGYGAAAPGPGVTAGSDCDDGNAGLRVSFTLHRDADADSFGAIAATIVCTNGVAPSGYVSDASDCDDTAAYTFPGAAPSDNTTACMKDQDGDNHGDSGPPGGVSPGTDCNDTDAAVRLRLEGYLDADGDGVGSGTPSIFCTSGALPSPYLAAGGDCDDDSTFTHPGAASLDSATACMRDEDGDNRGDATPPSGVAAGSDCDDLNAAVFVSVVGYADGDGDGYGAGTGAASCTSGVLPTGQVSSNTDCDDTRATVHPGAASNDSATLCMRDDDGDNYGAQSPGAGVSAGTDCDDASSLRYRQLPGYLDADSDGFGALGATAVEVCAGAALPPGYAAGNNDCDDAASFTHPGAASADSATACMRDLDNDNRGDEDAVAPIIAGTDCDDASAVLSTYRSWFVDADGDGFGSATSASVCSSPTAGAPAGHAASSSDCNDAQLYTFPGAAPNNSATLCMKDQDGDDWGDKTPSAGTQLGTDCNDGLATAWPGAPEADDGFDQDCDGDALELSLYDADNDGFTAAHGSATLATPDCAPSASSTFPGAAPNDSATACMKDQDGDDYGDKTPSAGVAAGSDCNDAAAHTRPGAAPNDSATSCMKDVDGDDWGDVAALAGGASGTDCNDLTTAVRPGAPELDDGVDQDCDLDLVELALFDDDSDGFTPGYGSATLAAPDCDDTDLETFPGAAETDSPAACMTDQDLDGFGDDSPGAGITAGSDCDDGSDVLFALVNTYADADSDGFGAGASSQACTDGTAPAGRSLFGNDCDDAVAFVHPGAAELESSTACMRDFDGDGYGSTSPGTGVTAGTDCQDLTALVRPNGPETDDGVDEDCNGDAIELALFDNDEDGYTAGYGSDTNPTPDCDNADAFAFPGAAPNNSTTACMADADDDDWGDDSPPAGASAGTDCNDADYLDFPGSMEIPDDGLDNDCNGTSLRAIDNAAGSIYVSATTGNDTTGTGSQASPYATLSRAQSVAAAGPIYMAAGTYAGGLVITKVVYGGYEASTWTRDVGAHQTIIESSSAPVLTLQSGDRTLQGVTIRHTGSGGTILQATQTNTAGGVNLADVTVRGPAAASVGTIGIFANGSAGRVRLYRGDLDAGTSSGENYGFRSFFGSGTNSVFEIADSTIRAGSGGISNSATGVYINSENDRCVISGSFIHGGSAQSTRGVSSAGRITVLRSVIHGGSATNNATALTVGGSGTDSLAVSNFIHGGSGPSTLAVYLNARAVVLHNTILAGDGTTAAYGVQRGTIALGQVVVGNHIASGTIVSGTNSAAVSAGPAGAGSITLVGNNLLANHSGDCVLKQTNNSCATLSTVNGCGWSGCSEASDNVSLTPTFVDADPSLLDLHLAQGSPLLGRAVDPSRWYNGARARLDYDGDARPPSGGGDLGADEHLVLGAPAVFGLALDCTSTGTCNAGGVTYPLSFDASGATSYRIEVVKTSGSGSVATVSPALGLISSGSVDVQLTTGSGAGAVMQIWITVRGPFGEDIDSLVLTQN